jgi:hypothetical protein
LNVGSGWNDEFDVKGSPLVFVELAEEHLGNRWEATFFEHDEERFVALYKRLRGIPRCTGAAGRQSRVSGLCPEEILNKILGAEAEPLEEQEEGEHASE